MTAVGSVPNPLQAFGALVSAYFSGSLLEQIPLKAVFAITAVFPLLAAAMSMQLAETRGATESTLVRRI